VNAAELAYIQQDGVVQQAESKEEEGLPKYTVLQCLKLRQTWAILIGKFVTDGVWWFFLFWTPAYLSDVYGLASDNPTAQMLIFVLYGITMLSLYGGKLPTIIINRTGWNAYKSRMRAMLIFALFPLLGLFAQPLGNYSYWLPIILIGLVGAAHQSWSANLYSVGSDLFPHRAIATITSLNSAAGGLSSFLINIGSGKLFDYADATQMTFLGFQGKPAGYFIIFCYCSVAYLVGWICMKALVPKYKPVA
jgi:ACS family hexuronate transporter-like MFS transporter